LHHKGDVVQKGKHLNKSLGVWGCRPIEVNTVANINLNQLWAASGNRNLGFEAQKKADGKWTCHRLFSNQTSI